MVIVDLLERAEPRGVVMEDLEDGPAADSAVEFALPELFLQAPQQQGLSNLFFVSNLVKMTFFKDRHYLERDWGHFFSNDLFSPKGKVLFESHVGFKENRINAFVCDVVDNSLSEKISPSSVDSCYPVSPKNMPLILQDMKSVLKVKLHNLEIDDR
ncbi:hypothetical protein QYF36_024342 [Acer negundo]|nr:hypothetical protein QYF36_024342 [Acer negundo]